MQVKKRLVIFTVLMVSLGLMVALAPFDRACAAEVRLKVAQFFPPPSFQSKVLAEFCKELEVRTNGKVKVDYYPGGSLLKAPAMFDGVKDGIADIGYSHVYYTAGRMPVIEAVGLPLGYPSAWWPVRSSMISMTNSNQKSLMT
jgi:TRAP-type C4-dicarboxylate transport system substrate-binding protein